MSNLFSSDLNRGALDVVAVTTPAPAAEFTFTLEDLFDYEWLYITATLTTDANAANRYAHLIVQSLPILYFLIGAPTVHTANQTYIYSGAQYGTQPPNIGLIAKYWVIPRANLIPSGAVITSSTDNIQAGDQWDSIRATFVRIARPGPS